MIDIDLEIYVDPRSKADANTDLAINYLNDAMWRMGIHEFTYSIAVNCFGEALGVVLVNNGGKEYVTWKFSSNCPGVHYGHYFRAENKLGAYQEYHERAAFMFKMAALEENDRLF